MTSLTANHRRIFATLMLVVACCLPAAAQEHRGLYHAFPRRYRSCRCREHGMVVAQEKIAARIGADVLRRGGNAIDAAVATGFALAVTYPRAGNIGGGGFMVIHSRDRGEDVAIDYREDRAGGDHSRNLSRARRQTRCRKSRAHPRSASASPARPPD